MHSAGHTDDRTRELGAADVASSSEAAMSYPGDLDWAAVARAWRDAAAAGSQSAREARLRRVVATDGGVEFLETLADQVVRFDTHPGVARSIARLSSAVENGELDAGVSWRDRVPLALGAGLAPLLPAVASRLGRRVALRHLGHLVVRAHRLESVEEQLEVAGGIRPVVAPVHTRALGHRHADLQLAEIERFVAEARANSVALSLAAVMRLGSGGAGSAARERLISAAVARLGALARAARSTSTELVFEVDRQCDLALTTSTVLRLLDDPGNLQLTVALTLPVNSNDSYAFLPQLVAWADDRRARGGTPLTVRFAHADELREERAAAHRWPTRAHTDPGVTFANLQRMLDWTLTPDRLAGLRVVVASEHAHDHAYAWRLARRRGVLRRVDHEVRLGVATDLAEVMKRVVGGIRLRVPVVSEHGEGRAADYLVRRVRQLRGGGGPVPDAAAIPDLEAPPLGQRRVTLADPCTQDGRDWFDTVADRARTPLSPPAVVEMAEASVALERAVGAALSWSERRGSTRATVLRAVAEALTHARAELAASAMVESGLTAAEADAEVTEAIGFALSAAESAEALALVDTAVFVPVPAVLALVSRTSPIADPAAQVLGALAAGSAALVKPAPENRHTVAALVAAVRDGGVPDDLVIVLEADEDGAVREVLGDSRVGRVMHTGSRHIVKRLRVDFPDAHLLASTGGRNATIVSESANVERAVGDVVASAFWAAGQAPHTIGTVIVVGEHERFVSLLTDAVASLATGSSRDPATEVASLVRPASGATLSCLTELADAERWLVTPRQLDDAGREWSPGLVDGVAPGSARHVVERRAPVLSIVRATTFDDALAIQNGPGFGLMAGLQSDDPHEIAHWLDAAEAGGLAVNTPTTGAGWERHPVAGWGRSSVGAARAPGGRLYLDQFGEWVPVAVDADESVTLEGMSDGVASLITAAQPALSFDEFDWVRSAARDDESLWATEFGLERDIAGVRGGLAVTRYRAVAATVRLAESGSVAQLVRVLAAATRVHSPVAVSSSRPLPESLIRFFRSSDSPVAEVVIESEQRWLARAHAGDIVTGRVRLVGDDAGSLHRVLAPHARVTVIASAVTASGRAELANFVAEQSVRVA